MGRAIVRKPQVFLMDEPLSNLDAKLRVSTRTQIASLQRRLGVTTVYVTHDQVEAMTMGDRVAVLKDGLLQQCATPRELYETPDNVFVAGFMGSPAMNLVSGKVMADGIAFDGTVLPVERAKLAKLTSDTATVGFRPEALSVVGAGQGFPVTVNLVEELGSDAFLYGTTGNTSGEIALSNDIVARVEPRSIPAAGSVVNLGINEGAMHLFDGATGLRVS
jgi:multiple sugar transport system ATP-binding protein